MNDGGEALRDEPFELANIGSLSELNFVLGGSMRLDLMLRKRVRLPQNVRWAHERLQGRAKESCRSPIGFSLKRGRILRSLVAYFIARQQSAFPDGRETSNRQFQNSESANENRKEQHNANGKLSTAFE